MNRKDNIHLLTPRKAPRLPRRYREFNEPDDNGDTMLGVVLWVVVLAVAIGGLVWESYHR